MHEGPILVITRIWPSARRPSLGVFVRDRVAGVPDIRVVRPRWSRLPSLLVYPQLLLDALRSGPIRGVEAHMVFPTGLVGLLVANVRKVPLVVYSHGGDVRDWRRMPGPLRWLACQVVRRADRLLTNSDDTARFLRDMGGRPVVIPPGVDLSRFRPSPRPRDRRVLYLGGRNPRKGYERAVELADTLVGPWLDETPASQIPALISEHDVVLVPSLAEPFGLVAVEAIASGRWVVASAVGGLVDIVKHGVNGTLVHENDFEAALASVPDYDPYTIAATVEGYSLDVWRARMADVWGELVPPHG